MLSLLFFSCFLYILVSGSLSTPVMFTFHLQFLFLAFFGKGTSGIGKSFQEYSSPTLSARVDLFQGYSFFETNTQFSLGFDNHWYNVVCVIP